MFGIKEAMFITNVLHKATDSTKLKSKPLLLGLEGSSTS